MYTHAYALFKHIFMCILHVFIDSCVFFLLFKNISRVWFYISVNLGYENNYNEMHDGSLYVIPNIDVKNSYTIKFQKNSHAFLMDYGNQITLTIVNQKMRSYYIWIHRCEAYYSANIGSNQIRFDVVKRWPCSRLPKWREKTCLKIASLAFSMPWLILE